MHDERNRPGVGRQRKPGEPDARRSSPAHARSLGMYRCEDKGGATMMEKRAEGTMKFEIDVHLPDEITDATFEESIAKPVRQELVLRLFRERRIAGGRAAHLLG